MKLFDILSQNERVIVWSDQADAVLYTWNQSLTLQCFIWVAPDTWEEIDVRTLSYAPKSIDDARRAAQVWADG